MVNYWQGQTKNSMKRITLTILMVPVFTATIAQWNGNSSTDPIWRKGNIGIGLEPSSSRLSVYQNISAVGNNNFLKFQLSNISTKFFGLKHSQNNNLSIGFDDGNGFDAHIIMRNTGRVGIGVAPDFSDVAKLSVQGNMSILGTDNYLYFRHNQTTNMHFAISHSQNNNLSIGFNDGSSFNKHIIVRNTGRVGIGIAPDFNDEALLLVDGQIKGEEVKVQIIGGADFVFENTYTLKSLEEIEKFINQNKHLPEIASEEEMIKNGLEIGEMNIKLLQKIEELTLYLIEQNKELKELKKLTVQQQVEIQQLKNK